MFKGPEDKMCQSVIVFNRKPSSPRSYVCIYMIGAFERGVREGDMNSYGFWAARGTTVYYLFHKLLCTSRFTFSGGGEV